MNVPLAAFDTDALRRDPETGMVNGPLLEEAAAPILSLAQRNTRTMAMLWVDVSGLQSWVARLSPARGLWAIRGVARRLQRLVRDSDFVARVGPESFAVVLTEVWETDAAVRVAHRLVQQVGRPGVRGIPLEVRVGVAFFPSDAGDVAGMLARAQAATPSPLEPSGIGFADPRIGAAALKRAGLERDLGGEDVARQFLLHYQPVFSMSTGQAVGVEALMRWDHAQQGMLPAAEFIPLAERTGRIRAMDQWALAQALEDCRSWQQDGWPGWVSVNLSGRTLADPRLDAAIERALVVSGAEPSALVIEVTESAGLNGEASATLTRVRDLGVWVAIDDFGTGYASFEYLRDFDPDLVKLDRLFVPEAESDRHRRLLHSLVTMAHHMGKPVVIEGVEEASQHERLQESGCDMIQGFLFGRPMPAGEFSRRHLTPSGG